MTKKNDGGPAYPVPGYTIELGTDDDGKPIITYISAQRGKSLRDWFAGMAMMGDWAAQNEEAGVFELGTNNATLDEHATLYYRMADAMLRARKEK